MKPPKPLKLSLTPDTLADRLAEPRPLLMGILNLTPDSFSDGGACWTADAVDLPAALARARTLVEEGAEILDLGGESTRPGAAEVDPIEERRRVLPVLEALVREGLPAWISVDTRRAELARRAIAAGASLINDTSAGRDDPGLFPLLASTGCPVVLMHRRGQPATMQDAPVYEDVCLEVGAFLEARCRELEALGFPSGRLIVDPGIGFGKTLDHNRALLARLGSLCPGRRVLLAHSRKRYIEGLDPGCGIRRLGGSLATVLAAFRQGVRLFRVHDVQETAQALAVWQALAGPGAGEDTP